jgi:O-antigen/teichoic acid export membrane protein
MYLLWKKIFLTSGTRIYSLLIGFITLSFTAHWLGPEGRGLIASLTTWVNMFGTFGDLSLGQVAIHLASKNRDQEWLPAMSGSLMLIMAIISCLSWLIILILFQISQGKIFNDLTMDLLFIAFLLLPLLIWDNYGRSLFMALDKIEIYNKAIIYGKSAGLLFLITAWLLQYGVKGVIISMIISQIVVTIIGLQHLYKIAQVKIYASIQTIKSLLQGGVKLHLNTIGSFMIMYTDILIISHYHGIIVTGYFQLAIQLISIMLIIPSSASMILYGQISQKGPGKAWEYQRKILIYMTLIMIIIAIIAKFTSKWLILIVAGEEFLPSVPIFNLMLLALIGMTFSNVMASQWIGRGLFIFVSTMTTISGMGNLALGLCLIPQYGMIGAVWGTLITYTVSIIINGIMAIYCEKQYQNLCIKA